MFSSEYYQIFNITYFEKYLRMTALEVLKTSLEHTKK